MKKFFLIGLLGALSACGGGGGGSNPVTSPDPSVVISKTNSAQLSSSAGSGDTVTASASSLVPLTAGQTSQTAISLSDFTLKLLHLGTDQTLQALSVTTACPGGGTLTAPSSTATSGTFTFSNCVGYIPNVTLNGSVSFSLSGSSTDKSATVSFQNFTFSDGTTTATIDVSMNINVMTAGTVETTNISYSKFSITVNNDYVNIYNFKSTKTYDTSTLDYTLTWDYTFESSFINGAVKVTTETPISGNDNNQYPYTGSVVLTGANNSHVRFSTNNSTGLSTDTVLIETDANGDGVYEDSQTMTWAQFDALDQVVVF